jgi:hypothetical protein
MKMKLFDMFLTNMKDYHLPICFAMFGVGAVLQWFHHLDMSFVAYTGTILGAITGHAFSPAQKDKDNVDSNPDPNSGK